MAYIPLPDIFVFGRLEDKGRRVRPNIHKLRCEKVEKAGHKALLYCCFFSCDMMREQQLVKALCLWVKFALSETKMHLVGHSDVPQAQKDNRENTSLQLNTSFLLWEPDKAVVMMM